MYYYLFVNNYYDSLSNIVLLEETYTELQTKNIIIFLFNSSNFENLLDKNEIKIVMSFKELKNYRNVLKDDKHIVNFLNNINSMIFIKQSLFGNKYENKNFKKKYNALLDFLHYLTIKQFNKVIFQSGTIYLLYGLRLNTDIDCIMAEKYNINYKKENIDAYYSPKEDWFRFLFEDTKYTFYFKGYMFTTIYTDINTIRKERIIRKTKSSELKYPKSLTNVIMAKKLINSNIEIPLNITKLYNSNKKKVEKSIYWRYGSKYNPFNNKILEP